MEVLFYITGILAILASLKVVTGNNAVHALLYLIVSLLSISVIFYILGAPFVAALEVIIYAGAIMVLFVFVVMMLQTTGSETKETFSFLNPKIWVGPVIIAVILAGEMVYILMNYDLPSVPSRVVGPAEVGRLLFTKYVLVVDLAGFLLAAGVIGAYHLGYKKKKYHHRYLTNKNENG